MVRPAMEASPASYPWISVPMAWSQIKPVEVEYRQSSPLFRVPSFTERVSSVRANKLPETAKLVSLEMSIVVVDQVPAVTLTRPVQPEVSWPVPPYWLAMAVPCQVLFTIVPKVDVLVMVKLSA